MLFCVSFGLERNRKNEQQKQEFKEHITLLPCALCTVYEIEHTIHSTVLTTYVLYGCAQEPAWLSAWVCLKKENKEYPLVLFDLRHSK